MFRWSLLYFQLTPVMKHPAEAKSGLVFKAKLCACYPFTMKPSPRSFILFCLFQAFALTFAIGQTLSHGPVVGGVTAASANVFVRSSGAAHVLVRYGTDPKLPSYLKSEGFDTTEASDFTKIIPLSGLKAETTYYLRAVVNGIPHPSGSPYPSFKTFAANGASRDFKFVVLTDFTTASKLEHTSPTFASASNEKPDFVFLGGDFDHRGPRLLETKRNMFRDLYDPAAPFMSDFVPLILEKYPVIHQWDDHDAGYNNVDRTYADWPVSQQVFQEYMPTYPLPAVSPGIWQKFSYAQMEGFVLDCRSQRDPDEDPDGEEKSMLDGNNLGAMSELQWLKDSLLASTATWKVIFTSVITNPTTKLYEGWGGYQREWKELKDFITYHHITGVVFISGDHHLGAIDNGLASGFPEMCVAAPNSDKEGVRCSTAPTGTWSEGYFENPCQGYGLVTVLTDPDRLVLQAVDENGTVRVAYTVSDAGPTPTPTPTPAPPMIVNQPGNRKVRVGMPARFRVSATGAPPLSYQWKVNGADIPGATANSYITPPTSETNNGELFSVKVTNLAGSVASKDARLTVRPAAGP